MLRSLCGCSANRVAADEPAPARIQTDNVFLVAKFELIQRALLGRLIDGLERGGLRLSEMRMVAPTAEMRTRIGGDDEAVCVVGRMSGIEYRRKCIEVVDRFRAEFGVEEGVVLVVSGDEDWTRKIVGELEMTEAVKKEVQELVAEKKAVELADEPEPKPEEKQEKAQQPDKQPETQESTIVPQAEVVEATKVTAPVVAEVPNNDETKPTPPLESAPTPATIEVQTVSHATAPTIESHEETRLTIDANENQHPPDPDNLVDGSEKQPAN